MAVRKRSAAERDGGGNDGDCTESSSVSSIDDMAFPNLSRKYAIEHQIGDGGQGRVFQVRRLSDRRLFACKSVRVEESRELDLVRQEVSIMRLIQGNGGSSGRFRGGGGGKGILGGEFGGGGGGGGAVSLVEVIVDDNRVWHLVLELCACSLHDRIQRERGLCEREAALLIKGLAKVVQGLHALGIVHRDLKPPNILLSRNSFPYDVKVADFGLSVASTSGKLDHIVGTTKYLAPEVVRDSRFDQAVDIWGLGLILYEALSGLTAFAGLDSEFVLERLGWVDMPADMLDWSGVGLEAKDLVLGMLCLDPRKRLTTQQIQAHPWVLKHTEQGGFVSRTPSRIVKLKRLNGKWVSDRGGGVQQQQQQQPQQHQHQQQQQQRKRKKIEEATRSYRKLRLRCVNGAWQVVKPCPVAG